MNTSNKRLIQLFAFLAAWAFVVVARLVQIQIVRHDDYIKRATRQQERTLSLNPVRGSILDARMRILAESVSADSIYADPQAIVGAEGANRPVDGENVVLTIDSVVQFIAERALARAIDKFHAPAGSAIVMDPRDGSILAMASLPTFDPNRFRDFTSIAWLNGTGQDRHEPGSTSKIVTASAGLEEGTVTPSQIIDCGDAAIQIGNTVIHEHGGNRYGLISFEDVMVHSSNVGAVRVGLAVGANRFYDYVRRFGFVERTGLQLPGETAGLVRRTDKWSQLSNAEMSIGQEVGATPLQVLRAVATVANGGVRVEPRIIDSVVDAHGNVVYRPQHPAPQRVISEKTAAVLNEILKQVVRRGTGLPAALAEHIVAGKTGTAQKAARGGYSPDKFVASFAGYVPADRPRLAILVVVDEPRGSQYGGTIAAPAFKEIAEATLRYLGVPPSVPMRTIGAPQPMLATFSQVEPRLEPGNESQLKPALQSIPEFRGLDARAAISRATAAGLRVRAVGSGVVQTQQPLPGEALPDDRRVTLRLGSVIPSVSEGSGDAGVAKNAQSLARPSRFLAHARNDSAEAAR